MPPPFPSTPFLYLVRGDLVHIYVNRLVGIQVNARCTVRSRRPQTVTVDEPKIGEGIQENPKLQVLGVRHFESHTTSHDPDKIS
jgi:hypothetical protein